MPGVIYQVKIGSDHGQTDMLGENWIRYPITVLWTERRYRTWMIELTAPNVNPRSPISSIAPSSI